MLTHIQKIRLTLVVIATFFAAQILAANQKQEKPASDEQEFDAQQIEYFENKVRPILVDHCYECHGPETEDLEGGLSLASRKNILTGGDSGSAVVAGDPDESLLIESIRYDGLYDMPPDSKLPDESIAILEKWVEMGAPWPPQNDAHVVKAKNFDIQKLKSEHWCWQPTSKPALPKVGQANWARNPIDLFILKRLEEVNLKPAEPASKRELIRRVYFDLIGLPPTQAQIESFLNDSSDKSFERIVDELLESEHFGEKWARHWMDLMRYAETCGHEFDYPIPDAWQYRDYLIRAFNADVPYDQFLTEHIAGDLIEPRLNKDKKFNESILGTGFWFLGEATHGPVDPQADQAGRIDNQIDVMSKTFLGLTVSCARCHDHKFDAISDEDYYSLVGFLLSSHRQQAMLDPDQKIKKAFEATTPLVKQGDESIPTIVASKAAAPDEFAKYLDSAWTVLRHDPEWSRIAGHIIESDGLTVQGEPAGITQQQHLKPENGFTWRKNHQFWWRDAKVGDKLTLSFEVPENKKTKRYKLHANFTKANDFGAATISLDGKVIKSNIDFYNPKLAQTGKMEIARTELEPGKHELTFEIMGHHEKAIPRHMIGVDYLELEPILPIEAAKNVEVDQIAKANNLRLSQLKNLVSAIKDSGLENETHIAHLLQLGSRRSFELESEAFKGVNNGLKNLQKQYDEAVENSALFADFESGLPEGWTTSGYAFQNMEAGSAPIMSPVGNIIQDPGTLNSGRAGRRFEGVLYSPTFTIEHDKIHFRIRGEGITIRMIIDGFVLDVYNPLLFNGMKIDVKHPQSFTWIEQAQDLKNHKGRRAHIEIIDHGDGWFMLDEIRFSNTARFGEPAPESVQQLMENFSSEDSKDQNSIAATIAKSFSDLLDGENSRDRNELLSWIVHHKLGPILLSGETNSTSLHSIKHKIQEASNKAPRSMRAVAIIDGSGINENVFIRGNHKSPGAIAQRRFLSALAGEAPMEIEKGSGRRELARHLTATENPLTRRVMVNRIWHHLMGRGIVPSVDNFGVLGQKPSHPELLDHLAETFSEKKWSVKQMIRHIVLTQTYQMSSKPNPKADDVDPDNILLHRARVKRLTGESIRDSILKVAGNLDTKMFGKPVPIHLTPFMQGRGRPGKSGPLNGNMRRSIYVSVRRNFISPMMLAFDTPIPFNSIGRRNQSNVPAQALILMNDPFVIEQANVWAKRLVEIKEPTQARINRIYLEAMGRAPDETEMEAALAFLDTQAKELNVEEADKDHDVKLWTDLCHIIFNVKEFIYIK